MKQREKYIPKRKRKVNNKEVDWSVYKHEETIIRMKGLRTALVRKATERIIEADKTLREVGYDCVLYYPVLLENGKTLFVPLFVKPNLVVFDSEEDEKRTLFTEYVYLNIFRLENEKDLLRAVKIALR